MQWKKCDGGANKLMLVYTKNSLAVSDAVDGSWSWVNSIIMPPNSRDKLFSG